MWCGCQWGGFGLFGPGGDKDLEGRPDPEVPGEDGAAECFEHDEPERLGRDDPHRVTDRGDPVRRLGDGDAEPLRDERQTHHPVTRDDHRAAKAVRVEGSRRDDEGSCDLHHGRDPVQRVVRVERGGEPAEVEPAPPDGEEDLEEPDQAVAPIALGDVMLQVVRRAGHGDHKAQVEEQLQRGGRAVFFFGVSSCHAAQAGQERGVHAMSLASGAGAGNFSRHALTYTYVG